MTKTENEKTKKPNEDEWGFEDSSSGFSKEAKIGMTVIVILASVLGYLGYQKYGGGKSDDNEVAAAKEENTEKSKKTEENKITLLPSSNSNTNPFGEIVGNSQQEPMTTSFDDKPNNLGNANLSENNNSLTSNPFAENDAIENPNHLPPSNTGNESQNTNTGNPFGNNEASNSHANSSNPLNQTDPPNYLQNEEKKGDNSFQTNRDSFQNNQKNTENTKSDEWNGFTKPVTETNQTNSANTNTTAGFETGSKVDQFNQDDNSNNLNSTYDNRNTQGNEFNANSTTTREATNNNNQQTYDSRFGGYRPNNSAQNYGNSQYQTGSSNFNSSNQSANKNNSFNNSSSSRFGDDQTQTYAPQPLATDQPQYHKIANGDNYWNLSKQYYQAGRYFRALEEYNKHRIPDPKKMREGMIVLIPTKEILDQRFSNYVAGEKTASNKTTNAISGYFRGTNGQPMYRTGKSDVLTKIAEKHLGRSSRWIQIYEMNRHILKNPNNLKIGIELRLPTDASNVRIVQDFREIR